MYFEPISPRYMYRKFSISVSKFERILSYVFRKDFLDIESRQAYMAYSLVKQSDKMGQTLAKHCQKLNWDLLFQFLQNENINQGQLALLQEVMIRFMRINQKLALDTILSKKGIIDKLMKRKYKKSISRILYSIVFSFWENKMLQRQQNEVSNKIDEIFYELINIPSVSGCSNVQGSLAFQKQRLTQEKALDFFKSVWNYQFLLKEFIVNQMHNGQTRALSVFNQLFSKVNTQVVIKRLIDLLIEHFQSEKLHFAPKLFKKWKNLDLYDYQQYCEGIVAVILGWLRLCEKYLELEKHSKTQNIFTQLKSPYKRSHKPERDNSHQKERSMKSMNKKQKHHSLNVCYSIVQQILNVLPLLQNILMTPIPLQDSLEIASGQKIQMIGLFRYKVIELFTGVFEVLLLADYKYNQDQMMNTETHSLIVPWNLNPFTIIQHYLKAQKWNNILQVQLIRLEEAVLAGNNYEQFFRKSYLAKKVKAPEKIIDMQENFNSRATNSENKIQIQDDFSVLTPKLRKFATTLAHSNFPITFAYSFLGTLISEFRNKSYVFLSTMRFTPHGNLYTVYRLVKNLVKKCRKQDMNLISTNLRHWEKFISEDISNYQNELTVGQFFYGGTGVSKSNNISELGYNSQGQILQRLQQLFEYHEGKFVNQIPAGKSRAAINRWTTKRKSSVEINQQLRTLQKRRSLLQQQSDHQRQFSPKKKIKKQSFTRDSFINQLEGLRHIN